MHAVTIIITEGGMGFGHISILLSELEGKKFKVTHKYGYYPVPTTTDPNSLIGKIKEKRKINLDLIGNHGMLIDEQTDWLDKGGYAQGVSIEIYPEQAEAIYKKCEMKKKQQYIAIEEAIPTLKNIDTKNNFKYYPQEKHSYQIFQQELKRAREKSEEPRLYPFGVKFSLSFDGLFKDSNNCKTGALDILKGIIPSEHLLRLTENGAYPVRPGRSGPMEDILLHSTGQLSTRKSKEGIKIYRKDGPGTNLYWTIPPQEVIRLPISSFPPPIEPKLCSKMKASAKKLQTLEWILQYAILDDLKIKESSMSSDKIESFRQHLIKQIVQCYEAFSYIEDKQKEPRAGLFEKKDLKTTRIENNLLEAEKIFENLYLALTNIKKSNAATESEIFLNFLSKKDLEKIFSVINHVKVKPVMARL